MSRFNLIDEKWIPARFLDGSHDELGIHDTLLRASEIAAIEDQSPLVVAALYRFLLAILYRALEGPTDIKQARALFEEGLPGGKITTYLEKWRDRFWLFDERYPFYQVPNFVPKEWRAWTVLAAECNADNAKVLFDHTDISSAGTISSGMACRWLLASQSFSLGGGKSEFQYTKGAPSASVVVAVPLGMSIHDTLIFSLVPELRETCIEDTPIWEREPDPIDLLRKGMERHPKGYADLYTWRTRSLRLKPESDGGRVASIAFASGIGCLQGQLDDPMVACKISTEKGKYPVKFRDRGLWRDFDSLLPDKERLAPRVIEHATVLTRSKPDRFPRSVLVLGQANNKAKIEYWRMERFALPEALFGDRFIRTEIRQLLADAEDAQKALWTACVSFARDLLSRGGRKPAGEDIKRFVKQMSVNAWYWSILEARFHNILSEYTLERDSEDIRCQWLISIRNALRTVWEQHRASVTMGDAWAIRALVNAEGPIQGRLRELTTEIKKLEQQREAS